MSTTFDGSTGETGLADPGAQDTPVAPFSALDALTEQLEHRDDEAERVTDVEIPGLDWRLVCATDFPYADYKNWQKAALPRNQRNGRKTNPLDLDQAVLGTQILLHTCEGIEFRTSTGAWHPLLDGAEPMTLKSVAFMRHLRQVDPAVAIRKLFGREAAIVAAGNKVGRASGWMSDDDAEVDPTD